MSDIYRNDLSSPSFRSPPLIDPARLSLLDAVAFVVIILMVCGPLAVGVVSM